ncbi:hypothetical protein AVEN_22882-1 [Araneus ventricosus]|uniref:Uncharacterized protein n=1 Tax=Araneus ventricosus TaxID=182803 RepID=A0A4Y2VIA3_ARAVE|nr:hypothetical protein AVEN_22882-1 [Araneus ventricosus]
MAPHKTGARGIYTPLPRLESRWPGGEVSTSGPEGSRFETNPIPPKNRQVAGLVHVKSVGTKCPPVGEVRKFGEGVPAQVPSSS